MKAFLDMLSGIFAVFGLIAVTLLVTAIAVSPDRQQTVRAIPGAYWRLVNDVSAMELPQNAEPEGKIITIDPDNGMQPDDQLQQGGLQQGLLQLFGSQSQEDRVQLDISVSFPSEVLKDFLRGDFSTGQPQAFQFKKENDDLFGEPEDFQSDAPNEQGDIEIVGPDEELQNPEEELFQEVVPNESHRGGGIF